MSLVLCGHPPTSPFATFDSTPTSSKEKQESRFSILCQRPQLRGQREEARGCESRLVTTLVAQGASFQRLGVPSLARVYSVGQQWVSLPVQPHGEVKTLFLAGRLGSSVR